MDLVLFYAFGAITLAGAILTISLRNPVHCAIGLLTSLLGAGGIFLQTRAEFLFAAQLVVYAGGLVLLFLFVIMLVNLDRVRVERRWTTWWPAGLACAALVGFGLVFLLRSTALAPVAGEMPQRNTEAVAGVLFTEYLLPFEIVSVLLLAALVGAVVLTRGEA